MTAPVNIAQFTYDRATRAFSAEMSDTDGLGRVGDDEVLTVVNPATGIEVVFTVWNVVGDSEGDIQYWELLSDPKWGFRMTLWND